MRFRSRRRCASRPAGSTPPRWNASAATATRFDFEPATLTHPRRLAGAARADAAQDRSGQPTCRCGTRSTSLADSAEATQTPDDFATQYGRLVDEAGALLRRASLSPLRLAAHAQRSRRALRPRASRVQRRPRGRATISRDDASRKWVAGLLAHEFVHSWNGKYRRPAGLATTNYDKPMTGELLWVYEGLTEYLGDLLPVRSGILTAEDYRENLAEIARADDAARRTHVASAARHRRRRAVPVRRARRSGRTGAAASTTTRKASCSGSTRT